MEIFLIKFTIYLRIELIADSEIEINTKFQKEYLLKKCLTYVIIVVISKSGV